MTKSEHDAICEKLVDDGKLIEAGFRSMQFMAIPLDAPEIQVIEMRRAFFAGAQHLFGSIIGILEEGAEPTANDLKRMDLINAELAEFVDQLKAGLHTSGQV